MSRMNGHDCHVDRLQPDVADPGAGGAVAQLLVEGMGCSNCANRVHNALVRVAGVTMADVWLSPPLASVRFDPGRVTVDELVAAVGTAGLGSHHEYRATLL